VARYSYEQPEGAELDQEQIVRLKAVPEAFQWYSAQSSSYRRSAAHWVTSAKRADTRQRRLEQLITDSAAGRPVPPLTRR
jgi:uncharacterized protein YdeI (YjbR/CyaY-like superfamily)